MKSLINNYLERQFVPLDLAGLLRTLGEFQGKQALFAKQSPQVLNTLKHIAIIQSTESSNRIEGITVNNARLKALVEKKTTPRDRPEEEVMGYRDVLTRVHNFYGRYDISPETILDFHRRMLRHTGISTGHWKKHDNTIEERLPDGRWITRFSLNTALG